MKKEKPFRKQIGFSQRVYSAYLGISKGMLSLVELGLRVFPSASKTKNAKLLLRWLAFDKTWTPLPPDAESIEEARKVLQKKCNKLNREKRKQLLNREANEEEPIDYQKAIAFLQQELGQNEEPDDVLFVALTIRLNKQKLLKNPLLDSIQQSLADRFLNFQIAEYQRSLDELGG